MAIAFRCGRCCKGKFLWKNIEEDLTIEPEFKEKLKEFYALFNSSPEKSRCSHLVMRNNFAICAIYKDRPDFCKKFPDRKEDIMEGCGFKFNEVKC